jgi:hypothetical protein
LGERQSVLWDHGLKLFASFDEIFLKFPNIQDSKRSKVQTHSIGKQPQAKVL